MNDFKEWLSDYLRYFLLILAVLLILALAVIGFRVYRTVTAPNLGDGDSIEILTEPETIAESETETKAATEEDTEQLTEDKTEAETETDSAVPADETAAEGEDIPQTAALTNTETAAQTDPTDQIAQISSETEALVSVETEQETETIYEPVYKTLKGSCYIRSGPSMEADIIGEYMYGTTVEFLEDVGGWYKVQIDGMVGYMGARFF